MFHSIKNIYFKLYNLKSINNTKKKDREDLKYWLKSGLKLPPPEIVKHNLILKYAKKENVKIFIGNETYINSRIPLINTCFRRVVKIIDNSYEYSNALKNSLDLLNDKAIIWIDSQNNIEQNNKIKAIEQMNQIIDSATQTEKQHILLWDNAHVFLDNANLPSIQELKTFFLNRKKNYQALKGENNVFVISPKL